MEVLDFPGLEGSKSRRDVSLKDMLYLPVRYDATELLGDT